MLKVTHRKFALYTYILIWSLVNRNYNYGAASGSVGQDILSNPDLVAYDSTLAFKTAFWFWTTASGSKPSCHDVMIGNWTPSSSDTAAGRAAGFGVTIDIINGGIECGSGTATAAATNRVTYYKDFCSKLGVDPGQNLDCTNMQKFSWNSGLHKWNEYVNWSIDQFLLQGQSEIYKLSL